MIWSARTNVERPAAMPESGTHDLTRLLKRVQRGDREAESSLFEAAYRQLRRMAGARLRHERAGHTLQPTALVNEAYLKLISQKGATWQNRAHFFAVASQVMRRIMVDYARNRLAEKRGGGQAPLPLDEALVFSKEKSAELVALDEALERLEQKDERAHRVVELRFFGGLSVEETAEVLGIAPRTVKRDWSFGRAWLRGQLAVEAKGNTAGA